MIGKVISPCLLVQSLMAKEECDWEKSHGEGYNKHAELEEEISEFIEFVEETHDMR